MAVEWFENPLSTPCEEVEKRWAEASSASGFDASIYGGIGVAAFKEKYKARLAECRSAGSEDQEAATILSSLDAEVAAAQRQQEKERQRLKDEQAARNKKMMMFGGAVVGALLLFFGLTWFWGREE